MSVPLSRSLTLAEDTTMSSRVNPRAREEGSRAYGSKRNVAAHDRGVHPGVLAERISAT